jgi:hypothetical protein
VGLLLDGRNEEQLEQEIIAKFGKIGIKVAFGPVRPN